MRWVHVCFLVLVVSVSAFALGGEHPANHPITQQPSWPEGLADALDSHPRVYGTWVNSVDTWYYRGDTEDVNRFLSRLSKVPSLRAVTVVTPWPGKVAKLGSHGTFTFDWSVKVAPLRENQRAEQGAYAKVEIRVYTGANIDRSKLNVPPWISVFHEPAQVMEVKPTNGFHIYLLADKSLATKDVEKADLNKLVLDKSPLISESDIVWYNSKDHSFKLRPEASKRLPRPSSIGGVPFVVVAESKRIYAGVFNSMLSSYAPNVPCITADILSEKDTLIISRCVIRGDTDPRNSPEIKRALKKAGKLK